MDSEYTYPKLEVGGEIKAGRGVQVAYDGKLYDHHHTHDCVICYYRAIENKTPEQELKLIILERWGDHPPVVGVALNSAEKGGPVQVLITGKRGLNEMPRM